jgi:hypothetical protein
MKKGEQKRAKLEKLNTGMMEVLEMYYGTGQKFCKFRLT